MKRQQICRTRLTVLHTIRQMPMAINQVEMAVRMVLKNRIAKNRMIAAIMIEKRIHIIKQMVVRNSFQMVFIVHRFDRNWV